jgi:cobalt/nickel transport system permease protein
MPLRTKFENSSWLHEVPAWVKLGVTFAVVLFTVMLPRTPHVACLIPLGFLVLVGVSAQPPLWMIIKRLLVAEFFILGLAFLSLLNPAATPFVAAALIKSNLCVLAMILLTWSTPFPEILQVLRRLGLPAIMLSTLALMVRYLPVLGEESRRMQRARASRTFSAQRRTVWRSLGNILGQLFIRTADRAERIYLAMCARGWK